MGSCSWDQPVLPITPLLFKTQSQHQLRSSIPRVRGFVLQDVAFAFHRKPLYGAIFPIARTHGSRYQGAEVRVALLTGTPNNTSCRAFAFVPEALNFA